MSDLGQFSGKTLRIDHAGLNDLFGVAVPIEALDLVFNAPGEMTLLAMRNQLFAMSNDWDQAAFQLQLLKKACVSIIESVSSASARLAEATKEERVYLTGILADAAEYLEATQANMMHLRGEEC